MPTPFKGLPPAMIAKYWSWRGHALVWLRMQQRWDSP